MSSGTAITNVRVFDGQRVGEPTTVVIEDGVISADASTQGIDPNNVVDGAGGTLLPGLIDTHVHVDKVAHLEASATWGVTTLLDMGNNDLANLATLKGRAGLPTVRSAGYLASAPGSVFVKSMGFTASTTVSGPKDAARFVDERVSEGSDYIKIAVEDPKIPGTRALDGATVAAIAAAARAAGTMTIAHVVSADTLATAVRADVDIVTHASLTSDLDAEFEALLAEKPTVIIPTLTMMQGVITNIGGKLLMRVVGRIRPAFRMEYSHAEATVVTFQRAGMTVLVGTDANDNLKAPAQLPHGASIHEEMERMVRAGLTPVEVLRGATVLAAETFGLADRGSVATGRRADLLLVGGDPTRDISATRDVRGVWIGGSRVR
ncbi:MAG TPA: amidohydrolase family protein [Actinocrinis sp.]|nr:amidohydrolase family protein [Actinocrinis sp.]